MTITSGERKIHKGSGRTNASREGLNLERVTDTVLVDNGNEIELIIGDELNVADAHNDSRSMCQFVEVVGGRCWWAESFEEEKEKRGFPKRRPLALLPGRKNGLQH